MKSYNGSEILIKSLIKEGVTTIFGYPGGSIMPLYDQLYNYQETLNHILVRHEQGAVHAAQGYARALNGVGVCMATAGPGATNLITGIADAYADSTAVVAIVAQVPKEKLGSNFFQEADIISLTIPITKWNYQITHPSEIQEAVSKAFYVARNGRPGPVLLSITRDCLAMEGQFDNSQKFEFNLPSLSNFMSSFEQLNRAAEWINSSIKPLIIAGQGVTLSGAEEQLSTLSLVAKIPVATTLLGLSAIKTDHELHIGNVGMHGNVAPNYMTQESDLIIALGMRFSDRVTGNLSRYAPNAKIIHVDIDKSEFNKCVKSHLQLHGNLKEILELLLPKLSLEAATKRAREEWFNQGLSYKALEERELASKASANVAEEGLSMVEVIRALCKRYSGEQLIVTDVGQHQMFSALYSSFTKHRSFITSGGLGTMGFGLPAAIGAAVAQPGREVVAVLGDGGFQMTMQELGTMMQHNIKVKIIILNNSFLGMVRQWQELFYHSRYSATSLKNPHFNKVASAYGFGSRVVTKSEELYLAIDQMAKSKESFLLEVRVHNQENVFPMVPLGASLEQLILNKPTTL